MTRVAMVTALLAECVQVVMTFIVNHDGIVYQKDLGPTTGTTATAMRRFNPDKSWTKVDVP